MAARRDFSPAQLAVLKMVQADLPDSKRPYQDLARASGMTESEVINFLQSLKDEGIIRRFGASLRHHKSGWKFNAMVAWEANEEEAEKWSHLLLNHPNISHAYYRPSHEAAWPYELYTMVHGQSAEEIEQTVTTLLAQWPFRKYIVLETLRELKKISMTYFD